MSNFSEKIKNDDLEIFLENNTLNIIGTIDSREPDKIIGTFFTNLHEYILKSNIKELKIDITQLLFLNSSGIKEFVEWILKIDSLEANERYNITFLTNSELLWQESSISTLIYLNPSFIKRIIIK